MLEPYEDPYGTPYDPDDDDWNPGGPGPTIPDPEDHSGPWPTTPEMPAGPNDPNGPISPGPLPPTPPNQIYRPSGFSAPQQNNLPELPNVPNAPSPNLPGFNKPAPFAYDDWAPPNPADILQDPSYQFRRQQSEDALQRWAAAKGTLNDSGTAKALIEYGGNAASQEMQNAWSRDLEKYRTNRGNALETYNTNYKTQVVDPYSFAYQSAIDMWQPQMAQWAANVDMSRLGYSTQYAGTLHQNDMAYSNAWQQFLDEQARYRDERDTRIRVAGL